MSDDCTDTVARSLTMSEWLLVDLQARSGMKCTDFPDETVAKLKRFLKRKATELTTSEKAVLLGQQPEVIDAVRVAYALIGLYGEGLIDRIGLRTNLGEAVAAYTLVRDAEKATDHEALLDRHPVTGEPLAMTSEELGVDDPVFYRCAIDKAPCPKDHVHIEILVGTEPSIQSYEPYPAYNADYLSSHIHETLVGINIYAVPDDVCGDLEREAETTLKLLETEYALLDEREKSRDTGEKLLDTQLALARAQGNIKTLEGETNRLRVELSEADERLHNLEEQLDYYVGA